MKTDDGTTPTIFKSRGEGGGRAEKYTVEPNEEKKSKKPLVQAIETAPR